MMPNACNYIVTQFDWQQRIMRIRRHLIENFIMRYDSSDESATVCRKLDREREER
jgi:hypothetical protein